MPGGRCQRTKKTGSTSDTDENIQTPTTHDITCSNNWHEETFKKDESKGRTDEDQGKSKGNPKVEGSNASLRYAYRGYRRYQWNQECT